MPLAEMKESGTHNAWHYVQKKNTVFSIRLRMKNKSPGDKQGLLDPKQQVRMPWDGETETEKGAEALLMLPAILLTTPHL